MAKDRVAAGDNECFVEPGNVITRKHGTEGSVPERLPQMPAYHLVEPGLGGITMINIGTGPSNARNTTDHVTVLRPPAWLQLGHCAGPRTTPNQGDHGLAPAQRAAGPVLADPP